MTNHRVHLEDVLHKLVEQQHHTLKLDEFFRGTTKQSKYWLAREIWKQHLKVDEAELRAFCERLALTSVSESLDDFRQRMNEALHSYGLKPSDPGSSSTSYDQLPYDWLVQGRSEFDAKSFREACGDEKLFADRAPPPAKVFGVKSFEQHGFDRLEARCDEASIFLPEFSDRYLRPEFTWESGPPAKAERDHSFGRAEGAAISPRDGHSPDAGVRRGNRVGHQVRKLWSSSSALVVVLPSGLPDDVPCKPHRRAGSSVSLTGNRRSRGGCSSVHHPPRNNKFVPTSWASRALAAWWSQASSGASQAAVLNGAHADQLADRLANHLEAI